MQIMQMSVECVEVVEAWLAMEGLGHMWSVRSHHATILYLSACYAFWTHEHPRHPNEVLPDSS
jgi:hypothetical protein